MKRRAGMTAEGEDPDEEDDGLRDDGDESCFVYNTARTRWRRSREVNIEGISTFLTRS